MECRLKLAVGGYFFEIGPPRLARVEAQFFLHLALQQIPGAFDVGGRKWFAVMPFDALPQFKREILAVFARRPTLGQVGDNVVEIGRAHLLTPLPRPPPIPPSS